MAAFCGCCGAEITLKAEKCAVCGMPRHGMLRADRVSAMQMAPSSLEPKVASAAEPLGTPCCER